VIWGDRCEVGGRGLWVHVRRVDGLLTSMEAVAG